VGEGYLGGQVGAVVFQRLLQVGGVFLEVLQFGQQKAVAAVQTLLLYQFVEELHVWVRVAQRVGVLGGALLANAVGDVAGRTNFY